MVSHMFCRAVDATLMLKVTTMNAVLHGKVVSLWSLCLLSSSALHASFLLENTSG